LLQASSRRESDQEILEAMGPAQAVTGQIDL
jgi:hypothetical protein